MAGRASLRAAQRTGRRTALSPGRRTARKAWAGDAALEGGCRRLGAIAIDRLRTAYAATPVCGRGQARLVDGNLLAMATRAAAAGLARTVDAAHAHAHNRATGHALKAFHIVAN